MRISTNEMQRQALNSLLDQQYKLNRSQQQLSTGLRFSSPSEDPIAAVNVMGLEESLKTTQQYQDNAIVAKRRLSIEENALAELEAKMQRIRQLMVQANNDTTNSQDRSIISQEISLLGDELVGLANSKDSNGEYLFSGFQGRTKPYTSDANGTFTYNGDEGSRWLQVGPNRQVAMNHSGKVVFDSIKRIQAADGPTNVGTGTVTAGNVVQPNDYQANSFTVTITSPTTFDVVDNTSNAVVLSNQTYSDGETISFNGSEITIKGTPATGDVYYVAPAANGNLFNAVTSIVDTLRTAPSDIGSLDDFHTAINNSMSDIDQAMESILGSRTQVGGRFNTIDSQGDVNEALAFQVEKSISELRDLDFVSAVSKFNLQLVALQSAQQAYLRIQNLSLFSQL